MRWSNKGIALRLPISRFWLDETTQFLLYGLLAGSLYAPIALVWADLWCGEVPPFRSWRGLIDEGVKGRRGEWVMGCGVMRDVALWALHW